MTTPADSRPHYPALDGLRGLAVAAVLLFHAGMGWPRGGFLGVSTFFTLSGFLITSLLLGEWRARGRVDLRRFWIRRARRLIPALLVLMAGVVLFAGVLAQADQLAGLRADGLAALAYVANWRFILSGQSYAHLFAGPSPVLHLWSLAIEEQFYLVFPLLVAAVVRLARRPLRALAVVLGVLTLGSVGLGLFLFHPGVDPSRVYYGTDTRAAELLVGALLAVAVTARGPVRTERGRRAIDGIGLAALAVTLVLWTTLTESSAALYRGGLLLQALASVALVAAAIQSGWASRLLSWTPLRGLGVVSYGAYLYHWPLYLWLSPARTGLAPAPLLALRITATLGLAVVSYHLLESPVRRGALRRWRAAVAGPAFAAIVVLALTAATVVPGRATRLAAEPLAPAAAAAEPAAAVTAEPPVTPPVRPATAADPLRVLLLGDSVAYDAAPGMAAALEATGAAIVVEAASVGFGLTKSAAWGSDWPARAIEARAELAVVMFGMWDEPFVRDQGAPAYAALVDQAIASLEATGARILVVGELASVSRDQVPLSRRANDVLRDLPARWPRVGFLDPDQALAPDGRFAPFLPGPGQSLERVRKLDGLHLCPAGAARLGRAVLEAVTPLWELPPPDVSWRAGLWALDPRYDYPAGSCPA